MVLTSTHNLCFWAEIRKIMYIPVNPSLLYQNYIGMFLWWGLKYIKKLIKTAELLLTSQLFKHSRFCIFPILLWFKSTSWNWENKVIIIIHTWMIQWLISAAPYLPIMNSCLFKYMYTENFTSKKNENFQTKNSDFFYISAQNIYCGYSLEPPRWGGSNDYPQSIFWAEIRKIMIPL